MLDEPLLAHTLIDRKVDDGPLKTQVELRVLATGRPITAGSLRKLLMALYEDTVQQTGFKYREHASSVYIYVFAQKGQGGSDWVGRLQKSHSDDQPRMEVDEDRLSRLERPVDAQCAAQCKRWGELSRIEEQTCAKDSSAANPSQPCLRATEAAMAASPSCVCP